ncbi:low temperature requirement protein A [Pediococcus argentinicus]|uniref:Low temperature requirement protein LtrA n=1 Tax=Pediococcus argentinicus TaxID=480391 RepID=A0A0R2NC88_9LACO|nr:low temperature requirement protein A [Pediococcus argentinicus]KRO23505.1 low temperature requirement protein LtrA [Pediococcus argentinicus]NKZ22898.1 low temperature requirement protein A [Pediococcus argentinicus]GEP19937.1 bacitracin ABC transporter permease [Pediococcus argentinicus]
MKKIIRQSAEVSNLELFYDLIFAYAISKITTVLHVVHEEHIPLLNLAEFLMMFFVFWTVWTYQTVYANRFFTNNILNTAFMIFDMFWVIILSQSLTTNFASTHVTFAGSTSILLLSIGLQYVVQGMRLEHKHQRLLAMELAGLLFICGITGAITIIPFTSYLNRFFIYLVSFIVANVVPIFMKETLQNFPAKFEHLTERYSLFTLLLFGESIIAVATSINVHHLELVSVWYFLITVILFGFYMMTYDLGINRKLPHTAGITLINVHYFIFVGLDLVTAVIELFSQGELAGFQTILLTTLGLLGFLGGLQVVIFTYPLNQNNLKQMFVNDVVMLAIWLIGAVFAVHIINVFLIWTTVMLGIGLFIWWRQLLNSKMYE